MTPKVTPKSPCFGMERPSNTDPHARNGSGSRRFSIISTRNSNLAGYTYGLSSIQNSSNAVPVGERRRYVGCDAGDAMRCVLNSIRFPPRKLSFLPFGNGLGIDRSPQFSIGISDLSGPLARAIRRCD